MNDIITHLRNASHACTDGYECSLSIREVRHVVALLAEKDAEIARLREALEDIRAGKELPQADGTSVMVDWSMGEIDQIAQFALAPLSPAPEVEQFVQALESAPK